MEKNLDRIDEMARKWLDCTASDREEQLLRQACENIDSLPEHLRSTAAMIIGMKALASETAPDGIIGRPRSRTPLVRRIALWSATAAAAIVAAVFIFRPEPYCYINGKAIRDLEVAMNETACFGHLEELGRSFETLKQLESLLEPDDDSQNSRQ